jgi:hypothetical protein
MFLLNVVTTLYVMWAAFTDDYSPEKAAEVGTGDVLQVGGWRHARGCKGPGKTNPWVAAPCTACSCYHYQSLDVLAEAWQGPTNQRGYPVSMAKGCFSGPKGHTVSVATQYCFASW